tara:strand:- start:1177 stop:1434 length:258 start_codon:yes stop_codon:yes gene_type:complete
MRLAKEIGRQSGQGQVITKDGKFWGYPSDYGPLTSDRAWRDKITEAIVWNKKLDDVTKVHCPSDMSLERAELKKITKTIIITEDE